MILFIGKLAVVIDSSGIDNDEIGNMMVARCRSYLKQTIPPLPGRKTKLTFYHAKETIQNLLLSGTEK